MPRRDALARNKGGRPSALTPERARIIETALRRGNHITTACALAGTTTTSFYRWMQRAERADYAIEHGQPYERDDERMRGFRDRVLEARAEAAVTMVDVVFRSAIGGHIIEEAVAVDSKGDPIRDKDGDVIINRKYSQSNGSLALNYLKLAQPEGWAGAPGRLELSGPGGGPIQTEGEDGEPDADAVSRLATRITRAIAQQKEHAAMHLESTLPARVDDNEIPDDVVEADWTEDEKAPDA